MSYTVCLSPSNQDGNRYAVGSTNEAEQCQRIADACKAALERCGIKVIMAGNQLGMAEKCRLSDEGGADLHVPIHTNAGGQGAGGTRVFCYSLDKRTGGYKASSAILKHLAPITPGKVAESVRAYPDLYEIKTPKAPTAYIEVDFHDVADYAQWIIGHTAEIAEAICHGICNYFCVAYIKPKAVDIGTAGKWSEEARRWAVETGLIVGAGKNEDGTINYNWSGDVTREQLVTVLHRFAQKHER